MPKAKSVSSAPVPPPPKFIDVDPIDTDSILAAAERFIKRNEKSETYSRMPGASACQSDGPALLTATNLFAEAQLALGTLGRELRSAGLADGLALSSTTGKGAAVSYILGGAARLRETTSRFILVDTAAGFFHFDRAAVETIKVGVEELTSCTEPKAQPITETDPYLSAGDIASQRKLNRETTRKRLDRWRRANPFQNGRGWIENSDPGSRDPQFL